VVAQGGLGRGGRPALGGLPTVVYQELPLFRCAGLLMSTVHVIAGLVRVIACLPRKDLRQPCTSLQRTAVTFFYQHGDS